MDSPSSGPALGISRCNSQGLQRAATRCCRWFSSDRLTPGKSTSRAIPERTSATGFPALSRSILTVVNHYDQILWTGGYAIREDLIRIPQVTLERERRKHHRHNAKLIETVVSTSTGSPFSRVGW